MGRLSIILTGLTALFVLSTGQAQNPNVQNRVDRWNDLWMNQTNYGFFGNDGSNSVAAMQDPCPPNGWAPQCELPGGSGQQYLYQATLWIGAKIVEGDVEIPRVSVGTDGWVNPSLMEFWPAAGPEGAIGERSRRDTVNCFGNSIFSPWAIADHEYIAVFADTLTNPLYVRTDFDGTPHQPLGLKVTRTTYSMMNPSCNHIYWIRYFVENIGTNVLRDVYFGHYVDGDAGLSTEMNYHTDDLTGFEPTQQIAYICDNDGRAPWDAEGNDFTAPHAAGTVFLRIPEGAERISFNWWTANGDIALDYGPSWEAYADRDSLGLGWTAQFGSPMGDAHKYAIMSNGEHDYDQVYADDADWILAHPQEGNAWSQSGMPGNAQDLAHGNDTRYLMSFGPLGNPAGDHHELQPGQSFELWLAYIGGMNFHDPDHPQSGGLTIDPALFDFSDLIERAGIARGFECLEWLSSTPRPTVSAPSAFVLDPVWPNPFNGQAMIRLHLDRASDVTVTVYDVLGRKAQELTRQPMSTGTHELSWNANELPTGLYFVEARTASGIRVVQKALLLK